MSALVRVSPRNYTHRQEHYLTRTHSWPPHVMCTQDAWNSGTEFAAPLPPSLFPTIALALLAGGSVAAGAFAV
ncbi:hypothetical protein BC936DRAFT_142391 [Jimgerdemannia flammicorona]|nr:hypothetical protein BC936DRAFT_142391 [Jimgerdemannia flammicorona]